MSSLQISVIVPVFNDAAYLPEALESILGQTHVPAEIIVVDDGSTDESASVARRFTPQIRLELQDHAGAGAARNRGVALARSPLLAFLDADDIWRADKLELQLQALTEMPALEMVFAHLEHFHSPDLSAEQAARFPCPVQPMPCTTAVAMLVRRASFDRVGSFDESEAIGEVVDWYARARDLPVAEKILPETLVRRRIHGANTGLQHSGDRASYARIAKAMLERRRAAAREKAD